MSYVLTEVLKVKYYKTYMLLFTIKESGKTRYTFSVCGYASPNKYKSKNKCIDEATRVVKASKRYGMANFVLEIPDVK